MNKIVFLLAAGIFLTTALRAQQARRCGDEVMMERLQAADPPAAAQYRAERLADIQSVLSRTANSTAMQKATAACPVPVVFHFVVTASQFTQLGGNAGIIQRAKSNLASLNRDFNAKNADSTVIPSYFKSRYGNVGIQFGLAKMTSTRTINPGVEVLQIATPGKFAYDVDSACSDVKKAGTGLPAWDVTKYLNVWLVVITDSGDANSILGVTVRHGIIGKTTPGGHTFKSSELGVVITPFAIGSRTSGSELYLDNYDLGRTLTHEVGHYFEIGHPWATTAGFARPMAATTTASQIRRPKRAPQRAARLAY